jgi:hypothetical protein
MKTISPSLAIALSVLLLAACASGQGAHAGLVVSVNCSMHVILEPRPGAGEKTQIAALQTQLDWYSEALRSVPQDAPGADPQISLEDDPVRLMVVTRGLEAAMKPLEQAVAVGESGTITVTGEKDGPPISEVTVVRFASGLYWLDSFTTIGFASDDPRCLPGEVEGWDGSS